MKRVVGLDSLRFVMAIIVVVGHLGAGPFAFAADTANTYYLAQIINLLVTNVSPGVAAVMVFFIISGFCIHYPYSRGKQLNVREFYAKRLTRILVPALIAIVIYKLVFKANLQVIWSLFCEVVYYLLYPLFYRVKRKNFKKLLLASFIVSYGISTFYAWATPGYNGDFFQSGTLLTWLVGLPVWLLGVYLAEIYDGIKSQKPPIFLHIIALRLAVWAFAIGCSLLRFHGGISYVFTLPLFSIIAFLWLQKEVVYYQGKKEIGWLAFGGIMSYSIYLMHDFALKGVKYLVGSNGIDSVLIWLTAFVVALVVSWIYYISIEKPSHILARSLSVKNGVFKFNF